MILPLGFSVAANTGAARTGTLTIAGQTFTVNQTSACSYSLSSTSANISASGGTLNFNINTGTGCEWTVVNFSTWLAISSSNNGSGNGTVSLSVEANNGGARSGTITVGELVFTVNQVARTSVFSDFDGDGKADLAVYRKGANNSQSYFFYRPSAQPGVNFISIQWGSGDDKPVVADYDRDGKTDVAVFRPSNGVWYIQRSRDGFYAIQFGIAEDKPVVGDYDGDGKADQAVFRPSNGVWYIWGSSTGFAAAQFGITTDLPVAADYDGDGKTDLAVFRDGIWYLQGSATGFAGVAFGAPTDKPIPNAFVP